MSRIMQTEKVTHIGCIHLEKDGVVGYHQAVVPQLLLIVEGEGWVRGETDDYINVQSGEAVFWSQGRMARNEDRYGFNGDFNRK